MRSKTIKNQIANFLATYHVLSKGLNKVRITLKKTTLTPILIGINQHEFTQALIDFSSICHHNQSDLHYLPQTRPNIYI